MAANLRQRAAMRLARMLGALGRRREPSTVRLFRMAARLRDEGRFEEAAQLVERGLRRDPASAVGHLMAAWLHAVFRRMEAARGEFERVLAVDGTHPRALLGLARIALEQNDEATAVDHLRRALARYPVFPEAQALLDVVDARRTSSPASRRRSRVDLTAPRLHVPPDSREVIIARTDGGLLFVQPAGARDEALATHAAHVARLAGAVLARAGLGALATAVIAGEADDSFVRTDGEVVVVLTLGRDVTARRAQSHVDALWSATTALLRPEEP